MNNKGKYLKNNRDTVYKRNFKYIKQITGKNKPIFQKCGTFYEFPALSESHIGKVKYS